VKAFKRAKTKLQLKSEVVTVPRIGVVIYFSVMMNGRGHVLLSWNFGQPGITFTHFSTIRGIDELNSIAVASFRKIPVLSASVR
jgi:hypothetical protein